MSARMRARVLAALLLVLLVTPAGAHVGSPDVFHEGLAGPYRLLVTIRPPAVVPGVAEIQIRSASPEVTAVRIVPLLMTGEGSKHAPTPDVAVRSSEDPQFFTGALWLMTAGAWQVRVLVTGEKGPGELAVPVPALPERTLGMQPTLGAVLAALGFLLASGVVAIVGALVRESGLEPGVVPGDRERRRARRIMVVATLVVSLLLYLGSLWWDEAASDYARHVYSAPELGVTLKGGKLRLKVGAGWSHGEDIVPDHGHLMHLFVVRLPDMEKLWHLHPDRRAPGVFEHAVPAMPAGRYAFFADVVRRTGLAETATAEVLLASDAAAEGNALSGDDSAGEGPPLSKADPALASAPIEGGRVVWDRPAKLRAKDVQWLRFTVEDDAGKPVRDLELYMGMLGHLAIVERERSVFAHIHPSGSVSMGALALLDTPGAAPACHEEVTGALPATIGFPYGFPKAGEYRLFLQLKRGGKVQTATFDVKVSE